jgi:hypothetical protein
LPNAFQRDAAQIWTNSVGLKAQNKHLPLSQLAEPYTTRAARVAQHHSAILQLTASQPVPPIQPLGLRVSQPLGDSSPQVKAAKKLPASLHIVAPTLDGFDRYSCRPDDDNDAIVSRRGPLKSQSCAAAAEIGDEAIQTPRKYLAPQSRRHALRVASIGRQSCVE